jgi:peptidoglycan hydrolase-like protein with peptidoglycan-binding domain
MSALVFTQLPLAAGSAIASTLGRGGLWALSHFMRAPLRYTGILAMLGLSLAGASNALYFQTHRHPAPLFAPPPAAEVVRTPAVAPVRPATRRRPQTISSIVSNDTTGSLPAQSPTDPVGNTEVFAVQQKLAAFHLFAGTADGYYGPRTATAIRAFEQQAGMKPQGALTKDVVAAILQAPLPAPEPVAQPMPQIAQLQAPEPVADTQPVQGIAQQDQSRLQPQTVEVADAQLPPSPGPLVVADQQAAPLPAPKPHIQPQSQAARTQPSAPAAGGKPQLLGRVPDSNMADQVFNAAADTAAGAFDAVSSMVADVAGTRGTSTRMQNRLPAKPAPQPAPPVAVASVNASAAPAQPMPAAPAQPVVAAVAPATAPATQPAAAPAVPAATNQNTFAPDTPPTDVALVTKVQRGLASLGFLAGTIDGVAGDSTAKAIRNFEVYYNYKETGRVSPQLLTLLQQAGAVI